MKNIKVIRLLKDGYGLEAGAEFIRATSNDPFVCKLDATGDSYSYTATVSLNESAITKEMFKATGWFEKRMTKEERVAKDAINREIELKSLREAVKRLDKIEARLHSKENEYTEKINEAKEKANSGLISSEMLEYYDEAITVYANLLEFIKVIKA